MDFEIVGFEGDGSKLLKQERSGLSFDDLRQPKCAKSDDFSTLLLRNNDGEMQEGNMLSFSVKNNGGFDGKSVQIAALPYLQQAAASYSKNAGYLSTGLNASMYLWDGPFTHSQWLELEHQALIYKYIIANEPIPPILLLPLRKALQSAGFSAGPFRPTSLGWGPFHLGFSSSTDPEPGRCRRTDGKKWRCSKDAVPDQKYCERHMNRGRHRSRKPVEGRTGHSVSTPTTTTTATNVTSSAMNLVPMTSSTAAVVVPGGGASNGFNFTLHQAKNLQCDSPNHSGLPLTNRTCLSNLNNTRGVQNAAGVDFLLSDSLLNSTRTYTPFQDLNAHEPEPHPLRHFIDDWPKNAVNQSNLLWPEPENHSERTHLSISIPTPTSEKSTLSPLRLARDIDPIQMGLGVGPSQNELSHRPVNWVPISWETSMGGPLGEALRTSNSGSRGSEGSPQMGLSPTGVLQKSAFGSVSSSSAEI